MRPCPQASAHFIGFVMTVGGGLVGTLAAGLALRGDPAWRGWWVYASLTTPAILVTLVWGPLSESLDSTIGLGLLFVWFGVVGLRLWQVSGAADRR